MSRFHFDRSHDMELVRVVLTHPQIYPWITDDSCPPAKEFQPVDHPQFWYVIVREAPDEVLGLWMLVPQNEICWEIHTCLLPKAWGTTAREAAAEFLQWVWKNTSCWRLITNVPVNNRLAFRFAKAAGMTVFGLNEKSFLKNDEALDQIMLGITKG